MNTSSDLRLSLFVGAAAPKKKSIIQTNILGRSWDYTSWAELWGAGTPLTKQHVNRIECTRSKAQQPQSVMLRKHNEKMKAPRVVAVIVTAAAAAAIATAAAAMTTPVILSN